MADIHIKQVSPSQYSQPIYLFQSPFSRAINVGYVQNETFIPGREHYGVLRMQDTLQGMIQTLQTEELQAILHKYKPEEISTITVLREGAAYQLPQALFAAGVKNHFGDAFVGARHIKSEGKITTSYSYENTEGLTPHGLWIIADSICMGRNLHATMTSLLSQFTPKEVLYICTIASRRGINYLGELTKDIPTTFVAWGALFGVGDNLYDMPWGHSDTEPLDQRDQQTFLTMYGPKLCVGGDFGNYYFSPTLAQQFYKDQLTEHHITPQIPTAKELEKMYSEEELLRR